MRSKIVAATAACLFGLASSPAFAVGADAPPAKDDPRDKVVCKTKPQTGPAIEIRRN